MAHPRIRDLGYGPGYYHPGKKNSILDVPGVQVGQKTIHDQEQGIHVGVTVIYPRGTERTRTQPSYAAIHTLNGGGEMTGTHFIRDWGFTASLNEDAVKMYSHHGWPVVAETWGGGNTDIHDFKSTLTYDQIVESFKDADVREDVSEGPYGGGAGMLCLGHIGGTGTSSRLIPSADPDAKDYVLGVLVQTNFGIKQMLHIGGVPIGKLLIRDELQGGGKPNVLTERDETTGSEGSIVICVITDAPLLPHQLKRVAARAAFGVSAVGGLGVGYNSSGDVIVALSTAEHCAPEVLLKHEWQRPTPEMVAFSGGRPSAPDGEVSGGGFRRGVETQTVQTVVHNSIDAIFAVTAEATEEAILNSLCAGKDYLHRDGIRALDVVRVRELLAKYRVQ